MMSALVYGKGFDLSKELEKTVEQLAEYHFEGISRLQLFRCYQSGFNDKLYFDQPDMEYLAGKADFETNVKLISEAILKAARFLHKELGVPDYRLLPYNLQLIFLTMFFREIPNPSVSQKEDLKRWFWVTSYSAYFTVYSMSFQRKAYSQWLEYAHRGGEILYLDENQKSLKAAPFPKSLSRLGVRNKVLVLFMMLYARDRGVDFSRGYLLKRLDDKGEKVSENMCVVPMDSSCHSLDFLLDNKEAFFIPVGEDGRGDLMLRKDVLQKAERAFVERLGIQYD